MNMEKVQRLDGIGVSLAEILRYSPIHLEINGIATGWLGVFKLI